MTVSPSRRVQGPVRLGLWRRRTIYALFAGLWASGVSWLIFHYFLQQPSEFGRTPHPLEPWSLRAHGAFAFGAIWTIGLVSAAHVANGWASARRRVSGILMLGVAGVMGLSGYLLYYLGDEGLRDTTAVVHWGLGLGTPILFVWHRWLHGRAQAQRAPTLSPRPATRDPADGRAWAASSTSRLSGLSVSEEDHV